MKSSLYFRIKLKKWALLHKLKCYLENTSKEHLKISKKSYKIKIIKSKAKICRKQNE